MNAIIRGLLIATMLALPTATRAAGYSVGHKLYANPETGQAYVGHYYVYSVDKYGCYYWQKVTYPPGANYTNDNHAQTFNYTITNYQPHAQRGNTSYGVQDSAYQYGPAFDSNKAFHLAGELQQFTQRTAADGYQQLTAFGYQAHQNQLELEKERTQALKITALAQLAESTKSQSSSSYIRTQLEAIGGSEPGPQVATQAGQGSLSATQQSCLNCHAPNVADDKGNGFKLSALAELSANQAGIVLDYVTNLTDNNCGKKAKLSPDAHRELVRFLAKKSQ